MASLGTVVDAVRAHLAADKIPPQKPLPMGSLGNVANEQLVPNHNGNLPTRLGLTSSLLESLMTAKGNLIKIANMNPTACLTLIIISYEVAPQLRRVAASMLRSIILKLWILWSTNRQCVLTTVRSVMSMLQRRKAMIASV